MPAASLCPSARDPSAPGLRPCAQDDRRLLAAGIGRGWPSHPRARHHECAHNAPCHPERSPRRGRSRRISCRPGRVVRAPEILRLRCCAPSLRMTGVYWRRESDAGGRRIPGRKRSFGSGAACFRSGCRGTLRPGSGNGGHRTPGRTRSFGTSAAHRRSGCHGALRPGSDRVVGIGPREHQLLLAPISIASTRRAVPTCEIDSPESCFDATAYPDAGLRAC